MHLCDRHHAALRASLEAEGLGHFFATSEEERRSRTLVLYGCMTRGEAFPKSSFEPFTYALGAIAALILVHEGPEAILGIGLDCPVCVLSAGCTCPDRETDACGFAKMVPHAAELTRSFAMDLGVMGSA